MRNTRIEYHENSCQVVLAIGNSFVAGHIISRHSHERGQLVYVHQGVMVVSSDEGRWVVPPRRAVWIPGHMPHDLRMMTSVELITVWVERMACQDLPSECCVADIPPLLRELLNAAADSGSEEELTSRDHTIMNLLLLELRSLTALPLNLPFPQDERFARKCREFICQPRAQETIDDWCRDIGISRRAFTRQFRRETGVSFVIWRQQACLFAALPRLAAGHKVTQIAVDLGYESHAAFTAMFKRFQGRAPKNYLQH